MKEVYIKKHWAEEDITFYLHFVGEEAVEQIEISSEQKIYLSSENPIVGDHFLYDQKFDDLDINQDDYITKEEFFKMKNFKA